MSIKRLAIIISTLFIAGIVSFMLILSTKEVAEVDVVALNEAAKTVEMHWEAISEKKFNRITLINVEQPFSIVDQQGHMLYQDPGHHINSVYDAIKNRDAVLDLMQEHEAVGKLIIMNDEKDRLQQIKQELLILASIVLGLFMLISLAYMLVIYISILKPFQQLQHFAKHVARGQFTIPLQMKKNNYFGAFTESFDLLREELDSARQREYESNRSKKELVATLSHDIKTPVASIKAISELMLLQAKDEKITHQVNTIYAKAEQINLLVTDMFHATLEELQQLKLSVSEQSSDVLIDMIENVNYDQRITCSPIPPCMIVIDQLRMQQVIDNIVSNAYKYAGTTIDITAQINEDYLELYIVDYGKGLREEELPLLFNKYYRGSNVEGKNGSGLGLYISKYFMENMGGHISCLNRQDGFTVILKIKLAQ